MSQPERRKIGASDLYVPVMGTGIASWGDKRLGYGKSHTSEDIMEAYRTCLDAGLNFFDTAEMYGKGESERLLGECRRKDGRPIIIATKYAPHTLLTPNSKHAAPRNLRVELDQSLQRLGVEWIDLYQLHVPPAQNRLDEYIDVLAEVVRAGKVQAIGVCNFTAELMRHVHNRLADHGIPLASTMVGYNLLRRYPETNGVLAACRELDVALIAFAPLAEGILTGKYRHGAASIPAIYRILFYIEQLDFLKERGHSTALLKRVFSKPRNLQLKKMEPLFVVLEEIATTHKKTIGQVALNWLVTSDPRVIPIPGAKNVRHVRENVGAIGWSLTNDEFVRISQAEMATR